MNMLAKIGKLVRAAPHPAFWRAMSRGVMPTLEHRPVLAGLAPRTVIDVGANKGQFSTLARFLWPQAAIYAFEPLPEPSRRYRAAVGRRATLFNVALGDIETTTDIHIASREDSSSLLPLGARQKQLFAMEELTTLKVPVRRLDNVLADVAVAAPALLKIDVQGFEYEVLRGLGSLVDAIRWVYVEASFVELYEGQKLYPELVGLMSEIGYHEIGKSNPAHDLEGNEVQADILFERIA